MTYATPADVANEFRKITFDSNSDITEARVQTFLDQAEAEINVCLNVVYVLPISGSAPESLKILKRIEIAIVAARIAAIIDLKRNTQGSGFKNLEQEFNKRDFAKTARKYLEDLKTRKLTLTDAELLNSDFGMSSETLDLQVEPVFDKCKQQW